MGWMPESPTVRGTVALGATVFAVLASAVVVSDSAHHISGMPPLTAHMVVHVVSMNVIAPALCFHFSLKSRRLDFMLSAALLQVTLLGFWHLPLMLSSHTLLTTLLMHGSLLAAACLFWACIVGTDRQRPWPAIAALLATGKLVCFGGALLVFAPHPLIVMTSHHGSVDRLWDQQLAGLVMLASCSFVYMSTAIVLFWRWLSGLSVSAPAPVTA